MPNNGLNGLSMIGSGFVSRENMVFNNQGGKDSPTAKPYKQQSRSTSKVHLRNKHKASKAKKGRSKKGRSTKGKSARSKSSISRAPGKGMTPGGSNFATPRSRARIHRTRPEISHRIKAATVGKAPKLYRKSRSIR